MRSLSFAFWFLFSLGTLNAFAATPKWDAITLNDQGMFFIDAHSIKDEGGRKVLWSAVDYKNRKAPPMASRICLSKLSCKSIATPKWPGSCT